MATIRVWTQKRAGTAGHQWSANSSTDSSSPWYDGGVQSGYASYPGANPATYLDLVVVKYTLACDVNATIGASLPASTSVTWSAGTYYSSSAGSAVTNLATGNYYAYYTTVDGNGNESSVGVGQGITEMGTFAITNASSKPRITFPTAPPASCAYNLYLTTAGGGVGTERLFCTGIAGSTVDLVGAANGSDSFWGNTYSGGVASGGSTAFSSATPISGAGAPSPDLLFVDRAALCISSGTSPSLTIASGVTLTLRGDTAISATAAATALILSAGATLTFDPSQSYVPGSTGYILNILGNAIACNGTSGSPCTFQTNTTGGGAQAWMYVGGGASNPYGVQTATWTNFTNLGNTGNGTNLGWGVQWTDNVSATTRAHSITNCTFTRSSYRFSTTAANWNGIYTHQYNRYSSSVGTLGVSGKARGAQLNFGGSDPSTSPVIDSNIFDISTAITAINATTTNNIFQHGVDFQSGSYWTSDSCWNGNVIYWNSHTDEADGGIPMFGPWKNGYFYNQYGGSGLYPHGVVISANANVTAYNCTGCLFDGVASGGLGTGVFFSTLTSFPSGSTATFKGNICLLTTDGLSQAYLLANKYPAITTLKIALEHNTAFGHVELASLLALGEGGVNLNANTFTSIRANLISDTKGTGTNVYAIADYETSPTADVIGVPDGVTYFGAGYNGLYAADAGNITGNGASFATTGYKAIKVSTAGYPSTQVGSGDVTSGGNPSFVDSTRCLGQWGVRMQGVFAGSDNGVSETIAWFASQSPTSYSTLIPSMMNWVRAGYAPTNMAYMAASYPGDSSTADAAGNPWPGGAPGIGAIGVWLISGGVSSFRQGMSSLQPVSLPTIALHGYLE